MNVLTCKTLSKKYGRKPALSGVSLNVESGHIVGLLGPNGSGKTTLIKLANGLLTPDDGTITVCGMLPGKGSHAQVSYLPERAVLPEWMSVAQIPDYYADFYADFRRELLLRRIPERPDRGGVEQAVPQISVQKSALSRGKTPRG